MSLRFPCLPTFFCIRSIFPYPTQRLRACGLGYGGYLSAKEENILSASVKGDYEKVLFHDGNQELDEASGPAWALPPRELQPGLRVLFAVGVKADGSRAASKPAMVIVK